MKYIKIKGYNLLEALGESARKMSSIGIKILPQHQMIDKDKKVSYGRIVDYEKFNNFTLSIVEGTEHHRIASEAITLIETIKELNADIDIEYNEIYILRDMQVLVSDIEFSGIRNQDGTIPNYDGCQPLDSQFNLKLLYDLNMGGIVKNKKAEYFTE